MKKKLVTSILMFAIAFGMCACGKEPVQQEGNVDIEDQNVSVEDDVAVEGEESQEEKVVDVELTDGGTIPVYLSSFDGIDLAGGEGSVELHVKPQEEYAEDEIYNVYSSSLYSCILNEIWQSGDIDSITVSSSGFSTGDVSLASVSVYELLKEAYGEEGIEQIKQSTYFNKWCIAYLWKNARIEKVSDWTGTLTVNGDNITLPCSFDDIRALGYKCEIQTDEHGLMDSDAINADGQGMHLTSFREEDVVDYIKIEDGDGSTVDLNGITLGMSVASCVENLADTEFIVTDIPIIDYAYENESQSYWISLYFDSESFLLDKIIVSVAEYFPYSVGTES